MAIEIIPTIPTKNGWIKYWGELNISSWTEHKTAFDHCSRVRRVKWTTAVLENLCCVHFFSLRFCPFSLGNSKSIFHWQQHLFRPIHNIWQSNWNYLHRVRKRNASFGNNRSQWYEIDERCWSFENVGRSSFYKSRTYCIHPFNQLTNTRALTHLHTPPHIILNFSIDSNRKPIELLFQLIWKSHKQRHWYPHRQWPQIKTSPFWQWFSKIHTF